jgi:L-alanine-DL-glutamate epimerase-like enolase superfamily enzyme
VNKATIKQIRVATIQAELPDPVIFGDWIMKTREFAVVAVKLDNGIEGFAFTLTRDGTVAEQIRKSIRKTYIGTNIEDLSSTYITAKRRSLASHSAGVGLRALSIVDLACWDALAKNRDLSITAMLNGPRSPMPATAIIGYPPGKMGGKEVSEQVRNLYAQGWRRFKCPVAATKELSKERLMAARKVAPDAWIGCDAAWIYRDVESALEFLNHIEEVNLGWFEDIFAPGDASLVRDLHQKTKVPIAMGDEQGGSYYPESLLIHKAVDVIRIDLTCMGGITGGREIVDQCLNAEIDFAPHMFAHVHSQVFSAWGFAKPIEWGVPWTGVDPYADSLAQPSIIGNGLMSPLPEEPGFGNLINLDWILTQEHEDPEGIFNH